MRGGGGGVSRMELNIPTSIPCKDFPREALDPAF